MQVHTVGTGDRSTAGAHRPWHRPLRTAALVVAGAVSLWLLRSSLGAVYGDLGGLTGVDVRWLAAIVGCEAVAFVASWELARLALRTDGWFDVAVAQLAGNAASNVVPAGGAGRRRRAAPRPVVGGLRDDPGRHRPRRPYRAGLPRPPRRPRRGPARIGGGRLGRDRTGGRPLDRRGRAGRADGRRDRARRPRRSADAGRRRHRGGGRPVPPAPDRPRPRRPRPGRAELDRRGRPAASGARGVGHRRAHGGRLGRPLPGLAGRRRPSDAGRRADRLRGRHGGGDDPAHARWARLRGGRASPGPWPPSASTRCRRRWPPPSTGWPTRGCRRWPGSGRWRYSPPATVGRRPPRSRLRRRPRPRPRSRPRRCQRRPPPPPGEHRRRR